MNEEHIKSFFMASDPSPWPIPDDAQCFRWWDQYEMLSHIREHSLLVAQVATFIAHKGKDRGICSKPQAVRVSALLHDIAKTYTIRHGGNHSQIGGAWTLELTHNPAIAQGVIHHVYWPGELDITKFFLPLTVIYADKRIMHKDLVSMEHRYEDLLDRYGTTPERRAGIERSYNQGKEIEHSIEDILGVELNAHSFDCRGLVQ